MYRLAVLLLLSTSSLASAVVIRHDVDDADCRVPAKAFPALADSPGEGHGGWIDDVMSSERDDGGDIASGIAGEC